jgi:cytochrome c
MGNCPHYGIAGREGPQGRKCVSREGFGVVVLTAASLVLAAGHSAASGDEHEAGVNETIEAIMAVDGDAAYGEYLGGECVTCHRRSGPTDGIPQISGIPEAQFVRAMVEYREKIRTNEVMRTTAARLSDEEIAALAAHFSEREPR